MQIKSLHETIKLVSDSFGEFLSRNAKNHEDHLVSIYNAHDFIRRYEVGPVAGNEDKIIFEIPDKNGVDCQCVLIEQDFRSAPFFKASLTFVPLLNISDIGNGAGSSVKFLFKPNNRPKNDGEWFDKI